MFCYKCGFEISEDALFCSKCGVAQNVIQKADNSFAVTNLENEGIKIYLSNLLALECMNAKLNKDYNEVEKKYKYEYSNNYVKRYEIDHGYMWFAYYDNNYYIGAFNDGNYGGGYTGEFLNREHLTDGNGFIDYVWGESIIKHTGNFYWGPINDESWPTITKASFWWDIGGNNFFQQKSRQADTSCSFYNLYDKFKAEAPQKYQDNLINIVEPLREKLNGICEEQQKVCDLLQSAYSANLIPQQYRNIHAVWFIHDFITTSNENLASALLHCDLDEIKQKLDIVIEQQREIIINQSVMMAQNEQMISQNQHTLDKLASIEANTFRAGQYAKMAANNAEACAWISVAKYIS